jgi:hypothetical protein
MGPGTLFNAWYRPQYRREQAQHAPAKTLAFFDPHLGSQYLGRLRTEHK